MNNSAGVQVDPVNPSWDNPKIGLGFHSMAGHSGRHEFLRRLLLESRLAQQLTQQEVARRLRRPQSFVSKYERGERRLDVVEFLDVAAALGVDPCDLLDSLLK